MTGDERDDSVVWHDTENGSYSADLDAWVRLAGVAGGAVLDLGCGTGRVAMELARRHIAVAGIDIDPALVAALNERAGGRDLPASATQGDIRSLDGDATYPLVIVPMQTIQLLDDADERRLALEGIARSIEPGGMAAIAIVEGDLGTGAPGFEIEQPLPDVSEVDGWVYSSLPLDIERRDDRIVVSRLRQLVAPDGDLTEERNESSLAILDADGLEAEALEAGLVSAGREPVAASDAQVESVIVLLEAAE